jgi:hypothetical protein
VRFVCAWTKALDRRHNAGEMTANARLAKRWAGAALSLLLGFEAACSLGRPEAGNACHADEVRTSPGVFLPLASGQLYQVYPSDNTISMLWRPLDRLVVCPTSGAAVTITNMTEKGETVRAVRIFNVF